MFACEDQRRQQSQNIGVGARAREDIALEQGIAYRRGRPSGLQTEQQTGAKVILPEDNTT